MAKASPPFPLPCQVVNSYFFYLYTMRQHLMLLFLAQIHTTCKLHEKPDKCFQFISLFISSANTWTLFTDTLEATLIRMPLNRMSSTRTNNKPWLKQFNIFHRSSDWDQSTSIQIRKSFLVPLRGGTDEVPFISVTAMLTGFSLISKFLIHERKLYSTYKRSTDKVERVSWEDYIQYSIDYYFSVTSWTKPLLLMSIAFILIFMSTCARILLLRENFGIAAWSAWTLVADAGPSRMPSLPPSAKHPRTHARTSYHLFPASCDQSLLLF
jgi:hypothetical protein